MHRMAIAKISQIKKEENNDRRHTNEQVYHLFFVPTAA
jgi:hypothetical protein